jgi:hypothetical protein
MAVSIDQQFIEYIVKSTEDISADDTADDISMDDDEDLDTSKKDEPSDVVSRTRAELADLDDLDV